TIGCLYLDRRSSSAVAMDAGAVVYLRRLAAATVRAIASRRAVTTPAGDAPTSAPPASAPPAADVVGAPRAPQQKVDCAMRVVRGERAADVAASVGATVQEVEQWHAALMEAALARMSG
ncbi:MAG: hypothetical protein ACXW61_11720, partial [Gemmatirosa sp.]